MQVDNELGKIYLFQTRLLEEAHVQANNELGNICQLDASTSTDNDLDHEIDILDSYVDIEEPNLEDWMNGQVNETFQESIIHTIQEYFEHWEVLEDNRSMLLLNDNEIQGNDQLSNELEFGIANIGFEGLPKFPFEDN